jgi:hypothetical protein
MFSEREATRGSGQRHGLIRNVLASHRIVAAPKENVMKAITKITTGAVAALATLTAAAPAEAQAYHDRGIGAGEIIAGAAVVGGLVAIASAISNDQGRYGYGDRDNYRYGPDAAVDACRYRASRYGSGRVRITDVDRRGSRSYRVRGVVEGRSGYGRYDRYDRSDRYRGGIAFRCTARENGRVTGFKVNRYRY